MCLLTYDVHVLSNDEGQARGSSQWTTMVKDEHRGLGQWTKDRRTNHGQLPFGHYDKQEYMRERDEDNVEWSQGNNLTKSRRVREYLVIDRAEDKRDTRRYSRRLRTGYAILKGLTVSASKPCAQRISRFWHKKRR